MLAAILFLAAQTPADDDGWEKLRARVETAPQDVATFIQRRTACNHWDGEVNGTGDGRDKMVQKERKKLRCDEVDRDEEMLRKVHRKSPALLKLLDDTKNLPPW